jgi:hypothetical protein
MNNYEQFINQEILNSNGVRGRVVTLTNERITIEFPNERKIFKPDLAFKSSSIKFADEVLNAQMMAIINDEEKKEEERKKALDKVDKEVRKRNKRACDLYYELDTKEQFLKTLFGDDFVYPPFTEFKKKFPYAKRRNSSFDEKLHSFFWSITREE